jgi:class 3 adenylate cyclase
MLEGAQIRLLTYINPLPRSRISFTSIAVFGLGAFVALAVGATLFVSAFTGVRSTQELLAQRAEALLDFLEHRLDARLRPVDEQGAWIARMLADGRADPARAGEFDSFIFGALGATPNVSAMGIVDAAGRVRRWSRAGEAVSEDWSGRAEVQAWLKEGRERRSPAWREPLWTPAERIPALLHDVPLYRGGRFVGMLGQVVPLAALSQDLAVFGAEHRVTPFILYGRDFVLAHPKLAQPRPAAAGAGPLPRLEELGDAVLDAMRSGARTPFALQALKRAQAVHAGVSGRHFITIFRDMEPYGPRPWTIGVYVDPVEGGQQEEALRVIKSTAAGLAVLILAVLAAALAGRRIARPVAALAAAASAVREGRLDDVRPLQRSAIAELDDAGRSFDQMVHGLRERKLIRDTLGQYVPEEVARRLLSGGGRIEPIERKASVLICDIEGFAEITDSLGSRGVVEFLNAYFEVVVGIIERHGGVVTQFQGDAVLAVFNLPIADRDHGANALRAAIGIVAATAGQEFAGVRIRNRVGLSTGRVVAGAVGSTGRLSYTVHGNAVNLAARLEQLNKEYGTRILLSDKTAERCPGIPLRRVDEARIRGHAEPVTLYTPADF